MNEEIKKILLSLIEQIDNRTIEIDRLDKDTWRERIVNEPSVMKTNISITIITK